MNETSKRRRVDPSAPDLGDDSARGAAARDAEAAAAEQKATRTELERLKEELAAAKAKNAEYAEMYPTFNADEHVASVVFSHVTDVCTRVALSLVNSVWRKASKVASSQPLTLRFNIEMLEWYKKGALHGNTECEMIVGCVHYHGVLVKKYIDTALQYFEKVAAKGDAVAQNSVGCCLFEKGHTTSRSNGSLKRPLRGSFPRIVTSESPTNTAAA